MLSFCKLLEGNFWQENRAFCAFALFEALKSSIQTEYHLFYVDKLLPDMQTNLPMSEGSYCCLHLYMML